MHKKGIIIVDDHLLISNSLKKLVESFGEYEVIKQLSNGAELVKYLTENNSIPDLILLDIKMPIMDGKETIQWLKLHQVTIPVLVLSMDDNEQTVIEMLKNGAKGYILKDIEPITFNKAIHTVITGGFFHTDMTSSILINELNNTNKAKDLLSDREFAFLQFCCSDLTYKEIASNMYLSPKTIDGYRENLFKKFNVKNRIGLAIYAIKNGYVKI